MSDCCTYGDCYIESHTCPICIKSRTERKERERKERERRERERKEKERKEREERERKEREERERKAEEEAQKHLSSLLKSISSKVNTISLNDFTLNTKMINKKSINLQNQKIGNLNCAMNKVGSVNQESINDSLNREIVQEDKNNYLYSGTEELSLENLKSLNTKTEKIKFSKKF